MTKPNKTKLHQILTPNPVKDDPRKKQVKLSPTLLLAYSPDGKLLQFWRDQNSGKGEWRYILPLDDACKLYGITMTSKPEKGVPTQ